MTLITFYNYNEIKLSRRFIEAIFATENVI